MAYDCIIIVGPTASGKTKLSVELAKLLNTEIISADSQQFIKGLDIGTAKVTPDEMCGIKHHMIDIIDVGQDYTVSEYRDETLKLINDLKTQGKIPVIVGGTGLYVNSLIYNYSFGNADKDQSIRDYYFDLYKKNGAEYIHNILKNLDPKSANEIHPNNVKRVVRAIEIARTSDTKKSEQVLEKNNDINPLIVGLNPPRPVLFNNIDKRVDIMMEQGLKKETDKLFEQGYYTNKNVTLPIGYSEWNMYYIQKMPIMSVVEQIKLDTRHYAKRQMTWFKKLDNVVWFNPVETSISDILNSIMQMLK